MQVLFFASESVGIPWRRWIFCHQWSQWPEIHQCNVEALDREEWFSFQRMQSTHGLTLERFSSFLNLNIDRWCCCYCCCDLWVCCINYLIFNLLCCGALLCKNGWNQRNLVPTLLDDEWIWMERFRAVWSKKLWASQGTCRHHSVVTDWRLI